MNKASLISLPFLIFSARLWAEIEKEPVVKKSICLKTAIPGPKSIALLEERNRYVSSGISIHPGKIFAESAGGALLYDVDGNTLLDFAGGISCMNSGHSNPAVVEAVISQTRKLQHACFMVAMYDSYVKLCKRLAEITPGDCAKKTALFNSGAEAVENAVKTARRYTGKAGIISFEHAFHGRTNLTLALTSKVSPYKEGFGPFAPETYKFTGRTVDEFRFFLKWTVGIKNVAAVILEPILGEGGFIIPPKDFVQGVVKLCKEEKIVFIADEIQTGFARTGKMFASEHFGIVPDLITMAKSMSNGFPLSAVTGRAEIMDSVQSGGLGGTFGGNPVSCAAALATIETIEKENLCLRAQKIGKIIMKKFRTLQKKSSVVGDVRGLGAMCAMEIVKDKKSNEPDKAKTDEIILKAAKRGLIVMSAGTFGNVIRIMVPLVVTENQLKEGLGVLEEAVCCDT